MAEDVTIIEITAQVSDKTEPSASKAAESVGKLEKSMRKAQEQSDRMKKGSKIEVVANFMDNASKGLQKVMTVGKQLGGAAWTATANLLDKASHGIRGVASLLKGITGKAWGITMKLASAPFNAIKGLMSPILNGLGIAGGMGLGQLVERAVSSAGEAEQGTVAMRAVAKSTGNSLSKVETQKKEVMGMGIQEQEANQIVTRFMQGGLDVAGAGKLARVAQDAAIISGGTSSEAAETMVEAIAKQNPALLSQFGMTKNMNAIYQDYADELGIAAKTQDKYGKTVRHLTRDMTDLEKKQALYNYVLSEGEKITGTYEAAMNSPYKKMGSLTRLANTLFKSLGEPLFLPAFGKAVDKTTAMLKKAQSWVGSNKSLLEGWGKKAVEWMGKGIEKASIWATAATSKLQGYAQAVKSVMGTTEFKGADLFGKAQILWGEIIAKPFATWWESTGRGTFTEQGKKISGWLGEGLHGGIMALLGVEGEGGNTVVSEAVGLGKEFADAFLEGFNGQEIWAAIVKKAKEAFAGITEDAKTILPGNETSGTGWLSAGLLAFAGFKLLAPLFKAGKGLFSIGKLFTGGAGAAGAAGAGAALAEAGGAAVAGAEGAAAIGGAAQAAKAGGGLLSKIAPWLTALDFAIDFGQGVSKSGVWLGSNEPGDQLNAGFSSAIGGASEGVGGALSGMLKGAGAGGAAAGPLGAVAGALLRADMGYIGGERLAKTNTDIKNGWDSYWDRAKNTSASERFLSGIGSVGRFFEELFVGFKNPGNLKMPGPNMPAHYVGNAPVGDTTKPRGAIKIIDPGIPAAIPGAFTKHLNNTQDALKSGAGGVFGALNNDANETKSYITGAFEEIPGKITGALTPVPGSVKASVWAPMISDAESAAASINTALSNIGKGVGFSTPTLAMPGIGGGVEMNAEGGIMSRPHLGMVAEDGAEAIIPLSGKRRGRGLALWERAGEMLGVRPYAEGAVIAPASLGMGGEAANAALSAGGNAPVGVTVENITFEVNANGGGGPEAIIQAIRENAKNISDELASQIAASLRQVFANTPKAAGGV